MARPPSIRDEDILGAAREVFLAQGVRATTAAVAERARVSEGIIFRRFKTKEGLFRAALQPELEEPLEVVELPSRVGQGTVVDNLHDACVALIGFLKVRVPYMMMAWSNPGPSGLPVAVERGEHPGSKVSQAVTDYIQGEVERGRVRPMDPALFAHALIGGVMNYVMGQILRLPGAEARTRSAPVFVRQFLDLLMNGAHPPGSPAPPG
ncbi:TetR/AcrR family transcriptional regulator [Corallococcus sp. M34]|uniref:TetR/AcrR family transcriptional regulator n=1 Tax=Citreicoccus inhibens TaxID=2849499 RepID=UPI001C215110|nr:TetR/AcrR family transcriptional regulator [Citreicoccus inhibens]MBU8897195.1 TetR/AcrR family transcriptional regulator [Citreicoccus inhibens]